MSAAAAQLTVDPVAGLFAKFPDLPCDSGPIDSGWCPVSALASMPSAELEVLLALQAATYPGLDRRGQAAFLFGTLAYGLAGILAVLHLGGAGLPDFRQPVLAARLDGAADRSGNLSLTFRISAEADLASLNTTTALERISSSFVRMLAPMVERLFQDTRLARAAQWRLAADSLAGAFLHIGNMLDQEETARRDALFMLAPGRSPLSNPQTGYLEVMAPAPDFGPPIIKHFLTRGGCCRYYTSDNGEYCATCVMRKVEDQRQRLRDHLVSGIVQ